MKKELALRNHRISEFIDSLGDNLLAETQQSFLLTGGVTNVTGTNLGTNCYNNCGSCINETMACENTTNGGACKNNGINCKGTYNELGCNNSIFQGINNTTCGQ